ncbi:MAG: tyrosine--tRNA ligase [Candidatus Kaiserbacteria bacterium]|nr:tyrosine--tRNA ligase [Candidatus Kaiserbacteria bacterium]
MKLSELLKERGYVYQHSSETIEEITDGSKRTVYLGIDPSADSLHVGNLMGLLVLRRFLEDEHKVILLTGGGTGMIGDPGGKSEERNLLDAATIKKNSDAVAAQIRRVFGRADFIEENNASWLSKLSLIDFLRDVAKYFTVNAMIKKDIVRDRLESESPISFTEFSYSLLQAYDYLHLNEMYTCDLQVGGSDQWSNILAGVEYISKKTGKTVYALTWPLIVNKSIGKKFGKSEKGALWLDREKTSPYDLYQFFINVSDDMVEELLLKLTLVPKAEIDALMQRHVSNAAERAPQRKLADEVVRLVHGEEGLAEATQMTTVTRDITGTARIVAPESGTIPVAVGTPIIDILTASGLASSKSEARRLVEGRGVRLNGNTIESFDYKIDQKDFTDKRAVLERGNKRAVLRRMSFFASLFR